LPFFPIPYRWFLDISHLIEATDTALCQKLSPFQLVPRAGAAGRAGAVRGELGVLLGKEKKNRLGRPVELVAFLQPRSAATPSPATLRLQLRIADTIN
jgi:hypothetical protein